MKTIIFSLILSVVIINLQAQQPATYSYTNGATNTVPGNPGQPAELYNGINYGQSNQINNNTMIVPNSSFITTPTVNISVENPNESGLDNQVPINPTSTLQTSPSTYTPKNNVNRLFQDPMKTPKHPNQATHVGTVDGSTGKFKNPHVDHHKKSSFAHNSHHLKTTHHHAEKTSVKTYENTQGNK